MNEKLTFLMEFKNKVSSELKKVKKESGDVTKEVQKMKKETGGIKGAFKSMGDGAKKAFNGMKSGFKSVFGIMKKDTKQSTSALGGMFDGIKGKLAGLATAAAAFKFGKDVFQVGMGFDKSMSEVHAISGATETELEKLRQKAKDLGSTTAFSAGDAADALKELSMAGFDVDQSMDAIDNTLMLAAASGMELADAAGAMTSTMAQFGLEGKEASKMVADQLAKAATSAKTDVAGLGEGLKYVGASAKASGIPLQDTLATLGMLNDAGIEGLKYMAGPTQLEIAC